MKKAKTKLIVSSSPHIRDDMSTRRIMLEVLIALTPALICGVVFFGFYALLIVLVTMGSAVFGEWLFAVITKRRPTIGDCSALVTGMILGLNLPPAVPIYIPIVGGLFAIMVVKMLFGGIGKNFANPAAAARIFLLLAWTEQMITWIAPITYTGGNIFHELTKTFAGIGSGHGLDGMAGATPLSPSGDMNLLHMFLGNTAGCIGETSALALLIGGIYLIVRRIIDWKVPLIFLGSVALFTLLFTGSYTNVLPQLLGGGLFLGAFFMATDYSTSPDTACGNIIYALGLGLLTVVLRQFTNMSEGVSYAIVLMNLVVPLLDKYIVPPVFGSAKKPILAYVLAAILGLGVLGGSIGGGVSYALEVGRVKDFYGAQGYTDMVYQSKSDVGKVNAVYRAEDGALVFNVTGYKGWNNGYVRMLVAVKDGKIVQLRVEDHNQAPPKGTEAVLTQEYLVQYMGREVAGREGVHLGEDVDVQAGATLTSNAVNNAVNTAVRAYNNVFGGAAV